MVQWDMKCDKCGGTVFVDSMNIRKITVEAYCFNCGKRWFMSSKNLAAVKIVARHCLSTL